MLASLGRFTASSAIFETWITFPTACNHMNANNGLPNCSVDAQHDSPLFANQGEMYFHATSEEPCLIIIKCYFQRDDLLAKLSQEGQESFAWISEVPPATNSQDLSVMHIF